MLSILGFIISVTIAYFIAKDAKSRGMSPVIWGIFGFLFTFITIIIYLIIRKPVLLKRPDLDSFSEAEVIE